MKTALSFLTLWLAAGLATAQELPQKTLTLVVGFVAGGGADTAARIIARKVSDNLKQTIVIDNRAGAGGNLAHQYVASAPPDGSVILLGSVGPLAVAPHMMKVGYDPLKDLAPLTMGVTFPNVLVVNAGLGVKTLAEYIALAKTKPGGLDYASTGPGSASHLAGELFNAQAGVEIVHIPYKGGAQAMQDLLSGQVAAYFSVPSTAEPHIATGQARAAGDDRPRPAGVHGERADGRRVGLSGLQRDQLVRLRRARQDPGAHPRSLEPRAGEGAELARRQGGAAQARPDPLADHARGAGPHHRQRIDRLGEGGPRAQDHRATEGPLFDRRAGLADDRPPLLEFLLREPAELLGAAAHRVGAFANELRLERRQAR